MIKYATVGTSGLPKAEAFFTELLALAGVTKLFDHSRGGVNSASIGNGGMIAFDMPDREAIDTFHAKAISLGGTRRGVAARAGPGSYMAYFRDLDGNKFCACRLG